MILILKLLILIILVLGLLVFLFTNAIHSLLSLIGVFFLSSVLLLILGVEFLAAVLIMVYVGAVAVLFLFVVMMLNIRMSEYYYISWKFFYGFIFLSFVGLFCILYILSLSGVSFFYTPFMAWYVNFSSFTQISYIGFLVYEFFCHFFLIAGLVLFVAMVGSIALTIDLRERKMSRYARYTSHLLYI